MKPLKRIGIVAVSAEGAALCYRTICNEAASLLGEHRHPEICLHSFSLADYMRPIDADRWDQVGELMLQSAQKLVAIGAEILVCPDNTVHQGLDLVRARAPAPWLHIAEQVAMVAASCGYRRLGILGTRYLMEGPVYPAALAKHGIAYEIPEPAERNRINEIIFSELITGVLNGSSRQYFQSVINQLASRHCDAVVLGCTEIPLLITGADSTLPVIDSTRTLARAALNAAITATE